MKPALLYFFLLIFICLESALCDRNIQVGVIPNDTDGNPINAHGGHIIIENGTYFWFGESDKSSDENRGVNCYSSPDLITWDFQGSMVTASMINEGAGRQDVTVVERPKVIYNSLISIFVMFIHVDTADYSLASVAVFTAKHVTGPYTFVRVMRPNDLESRDIGIFVDEDNVPYLLYASGHVNTGLTISSLTKDYTNAAGVVCTIDGSYEAPTIMRGNGGYYLMVSRTTGWGANEGKLFWASSLSGPWIDNGPISANDTSYNSQSTFLLPLNGTDGAVHYVYMGDRWNYPDLAHASYVWLPVQIAPPGVTPGVQLYSIEGDTWDLDSYLAGQPTKDEQAISFLIKQHSTHKKLIN